MDRTERNRFFERIAVLRYRNRCAGDADRRSVMSIDDAVLWASAVMAALEAEQAEAANADGLAATVRYDELPAAVHEPRD